MRGSVTAMVMTFCRVNTRICTYIPFLSFFMTYLSILNLRPITLFEGEGQDGYRLLQLLCEIVIRRSKEDVYQRKGESPWNFSKGSTENIQGT